MVVDEGTELGGVCGNADRLKDPLNMFSDHFERERISAAIMEAMNIPQMYSIPLPSQLRVSLFEQKVNGLREESRRKFVVYPEQFKDIKTELL